MADLQVSLALLLENQAEIARELAKAGGQAGADFGRGLSAEAQKAFNDLVSQAEKAAKEAGLRFNKVKLQFETVSGDVIPQKTLDQIGKVNRGFAEARQAVEAFKSATTAATRESAAGMNLLEAAVTGVAVSLTSRLTDAAGTALGSVRGLVQGFLELDGELRLASAAAGETGGYQRLSQIVDKVGIDAAGTTKQVAELATSLVRAGFSISEVEGALAGVVRGAEATGTGFEAFGNIVGNTLRGFGLEVDKTAQVVDVITKTVNASNASVEGLGYTFQYTAPIAKALGVSLEDVAAATGLMANAGIQGSVAGTGLRTFLEKIQQASKGASPEVLGLSRGSERLQKVMAMLGATVVDSSGKLIGLEQVFLQLKAGMDKLSQADKVQLSNVLFGDEASSKVMAITNQSTTSISKMFREIYNSKGATDTARTAMSGLGLEIQQLTGTMDSLRNNIGGVMAAGLRPLVGAANAAVGAISGLPKPVKDTGAALVALGIASTGAAISISALNLVLAQTGGLAGLAIAARAAGVAVAGIGGSLAIVLAAAAGIALLTGRFAEMDATTKTLVQTTIALGAGVLVFRGIAAATGVASVALGLLNVQLGRTAVLTALASGAAKGGLLVGLVGAAAAAATVYGVLNNNIKTTGEDTEALSGKARELKDQIAQLQKEIADGKKLGIDTTDAQRRVDELYMKLREIERPLELKLSIEKAKSEAKTLKDELSKLSEGDSGRPGLQAKVDGAERYLKLLQQIDRAQAVTDASPVTQQGAKDLAELEKRVNQLLARKLTLPVKAPEQKDIDKELDIYQRQIDLRKVGIRVAIDREEAVRQLGELQGAIAVALSKGVDPTKLRSQLLPLQIQVRNLDLERDKINKNLAATLNQQVAADGKRVLTAKEQLEAAKGKLSVEQISIQVGEAALNNDRNRLSLVQQIVSAYGNLAQAQGALRQSGFDVESNRVSRRISSEEKILQLLRDQGASGSVIEAQVDKIGRLRKEQEDIEAFAARSRIEFLAQEFEIQRKTLQLKQIGEYLDQKSAERKARSNVLTVSGEILELQKALNDPSTTQQQRQNILDQIVGRQELLKLAKEQEAQEVAQGQRLGVIFSLQNQTLEAQQQTTANQERASAALKGWEEYLSPNLDKLDAVAGNYERIGESQKRLVGTIQAGNGPVIEIYDQVKELPTFLGKATSAADDLAGGLSRANTQADTLLQTVSKLANAPSARWAGGGVDPGGRYQVNELGVESFLSRSGALSLIHAPAYGSWSPPSPGMVLPAGLTARLDAMGAFSGGAPAPVLAGIAPAMGSGSGSQQVAALGRLQRSIDALEGTMRSYRPEVTVNLPGNAGLLHTLQGFR